MSAITMFLTVIIIILFLLVCVLAWMISHMVDAVSSLLEVEKQHLLEKAVQYKRSKPWVSND